MSITVAAPTFEHTRPGTALGIGVGAPRMSWKITAPPGWMQSGYRLRIDDGEREREHQVTDAESVLRPWPGRPLGSTERASVRVRVYGADRSSSDWSDPAVVETGLLHPSDWIARPVGGGWDEDPDSDDRRPSLVRRGFETTGSPVRARLYVSAHGLYEVELNGTRVGDDAMAPGWTAYRHRLRYYTYDVTELIRPGGNAIGAWLGDGWYRGRLGWNGGFRNLFGSDLSLIAQLHLDYADGHRQVIATDESWRAATGPIIRTGNYDGEVHDARQQRPGWSAADYDDAGWTPVALAERDPATLVAPEGPPVRCTEEVLPVELITSPSGAQVLDFGQNLVGRLRIRVSGAAGDRVIIRTAEVLQSGGIYTRPLRGARSTDEYVLAGREIEEWEPRFTFHGFRYAEISGWPGDLAAAVADGDLVARVYHTDLERTGWFDCSDPALNRLHQNVLWSMRGNFLDIPTDCPQRDERVGWTGDLQVFAPTASFLYDVSGMLSSWLKDLSAEQLPDGTVPWYVPVIPAHKMWTPIRPGAAWGDVATLTPWELYQRFGDVGILRAQYDSARRWVELVERLAGDDHLWDEGFQLGDWLDPSAPPQDPAEARTDRYLVATAYFARSADRLARIAAVLGHDQDAERFRQLAEQVRAAFGTAYLLPDGRMTSDAQTAYSLAIAFDLADDDQRVRAGDRLAELAAEADHRIATGFVGVGLVSDALTATGHTEAAYRLLLQRQPPSWLYAVDQGASTVWERWDSLLPDGTVNPGTMTSFNHYALGAVADWMHRVIAGLAAAEPGYRKIIFRPRPGGGLTHAAAEHETPYGRAAIRWQLHDSELIVDVTVPSQTTATVQLPGADPVDVASGRHRFTGRL